MKDYLVKRISGRISRRDLLWSIAVSGGAISAPFVLNIQVLGGFLMNSEKVTPAKAAVDHLILSLEASTRGGELGMRSFRLEADNTWRFSRLTPINRASR